MGIDRKYGRVTTERGTIGKDEPVVVFRGRDLALLSTLVHYLHLCEELDSPHQHLESVRATIRQIREWQSDHPIRVPSSDVPPEPAG